MRAKFECVGVGAGSRVGHDFLGKSISYTTHTQGEIFLLSHIFVVVVVVIVVFLCFLFFRKLFHTLRQDRILKYFVLFCVYKFQTK